jgi:hypothetical protein
VLLPKIRHEEPRQGKSPRRIKAFESPNELLLGHRQGLQEMENSMSIVTRITDEGF